MDNSTYHSTLGLDQSRWSPDAYPEYMPEPDLYHTGIWLDSHQGSGNAPYSPVLSDLTLPTSEISLGSIGPGATQEMPMVDAFVSAHWSNDLANGSYADEPATSEQSFFSFPSDAPHPDAGYQSWFSPSAIKMESYFHMSPTEQITAYTSVPPQTAGFVGSEPWMPSTQVGTYQVTGSAQGSSQQAPGSRAPFFRSDSVVHNVACSDVASTSISQSSQSPELSARRPPRRLSVALKPSVAWKAHNHEHRDYQAHQHPRSLASGGPVASASSLLPTEAQRRTLGPMYGSTAPGIPSMASSTGPVRSESSVMSPASPISMTGRSEDGDAKQPRSHPLYTTAAPQSDGYYHCAFAGREDCTHKPTKLKCNYDKYIDSHLRPFVCKSDKCRDNRFSSTACLLRHEREAHGLHGHGEKPYRCEYEGCDRALPGNGFPRNYNLLDHMKRVHGHQAESKAQSTTGSSTSKRSSRVDSTNKIRKKRASDGPKRTHTGSSSSSRRAGAQTVSPAPTLSDQGQQYNQQMAEFNACKDKLQQQLQRMQDPREAASQLQDMTQKISRRWG